MPTQPWMHSARFDLLWILSPPFFAVLLVAVLQLFFPDFMREPLAPGLWLMTVVGIDVAHVYSTVYRAGQKPRLLWLVPLLGLVASVILYRMGPVVFWRSLAYLAVFHFVRQPYGIMRFYQRTERSTRIDQLAIYGASLYPLAVWHLGSGRDFGWFMEGDLWVWNAAFLLPYAHAAALAIAFAYGWQEWKARALNVPKNLVVLGTAAAWGLGIVVWNSDLAFTLTNVISHGVPYMAMIWIFNGMKFWRPGTSTDWRWVAPLLFVLTLFVLAYAEEGLWDAWVWTDHPQVFPWFSYHFQPAEDSSLVWIVPLLALPQLTHYVLDGFLWRLGRSGS
ncbi:MAG TPA: hypothetical protein VE954_18760 [Oligoflexus sp.]|uniref:hypothetical protein n=1 Tax=Oligoflexus sp. TaxID=1971216 RepID=UPI002D6DCC6D|nr:hypothetical protein [Oligoflexus sp.]HYX35143.1 hypothetical protein [Oligoflexus sp.]